MAVVLIAIQIIADRSMRWKLFIADSWNETSKQGDSP